MNIKLHARLRAYTKSQEFEKITEELKDILSFMNSIPTEDGQYVLNVKTQGDTKTFLWSDNFVLDQNEE